MKPHFQVAKLIIGIISILFAVMMLFASCASGTVSAISAVDSSKSFEMDMLTGGTMIFGVTTLIIGIVSIAERKSTKLGGDITCLVLSSIISIIIIVGLGGAFGWIYAVLFIIASVFYILSIILKNKDKKKADAETPTS